MRRKLLPFYDQRKCKIDMIVLHCEGYSLQEAIAIFVKNKVSAHYMIDEQGEVWQLVGEKHRAWHAGKSSWQGKDDINSYSIGIELISPTMGQKKFPAKQRKSLIALLERLVKKYKIMPQNIVGHSDIAPSRKVDPGKEFFWQDLVAKGWGFGYDKSFKYSVQNFNEKELLQQIGYETTDIKAAKLAFCRHFLPAEVPDEKDIEGMEKNLPHTIKNFKEPQDYKKTLQNIAQQYARASKTPCKM